MTHGVATLYHKCGTCSKIRHRSIRPNSKTGDRLKKYSQYNLTWSFLVDDKLNVEIQIQSTDTTSRDITINVIFSDCRQRSLLPAPYRLYAQ